MDNVFNFGEVVEGYKIKVLNEREVRAAAGILLLGLLASLVPILLYGDFLVIKYYVTMFLTDFIIRVFVNPKFSPSLIIGRLIVGNQTPEYVGALQKKFSWTIGIFMAGIMFIFLVIVNAYSPITGITCLICFIFLFFETAFGICLGCKFYSMFYKEKAQHCPGEVCDLKSGQEIQKTSSAQILIVCGFILYLLLTVFLLKDTFSKKPYALFGSKNSEPYKFELY
ncbi:MAG: DUF4395 domain-containing protein [Bacteroidota bacterium]